ncbi:hypothetical protein GH714_016410 [Hevea brasiliensis]|uniref:Uncharacterized protein n=1 Tax=Hevea brasiliensis TaxID=3981 RepID=A0A6A6M1Y4_HEVBR|nr:hypothetical protein GH714_016410 [Hevea brasiliensis]
MSDKEGEAAGAQEMDSQKLSSPSAQQNFPVVSRREVSDLLCWDLQDIAWSRVVSVARVAKLGWATLVVDNGQAMEEDGDGCSVKRLYSPMVDLEFGFWLGLTDLI